MSAVLDAGFQTCSPAASSRLGRLRGFESGARETDDAEVIVSGELPVWLRGSLLLNGPALWDLAQRSYEHWFDGLALLHRVRIADGRARYRSRYLQSEDYRWSVREQHPTFRSFGSRDSFGWFERLKQFRSPQISDNGSVVMSRVGSQWIATTEGPHLTLFDADTLATGGHLPFEDDVVFQLMSAHGITDRHGGYWNIGVELGPKCTYKLFRLRPEARRREVVGTVKVRACGYTHAFAMTQRHALIWETALRVQPLGFIFSGRAYMRNFHWRPKSGSMLHAIGLDDGKVTSWSIPPMMCFHAIQAYERGDEIVAELCVQDDGQIFEDLMLAPRRAGAALKSKLHLRRYRLQRGRADAVIEPFGEAMDLPQVHPGQWAGGVAEVAWGAGNDPADNVFFDRTVRIDLATGERREWQRGGAIQLEPLVVPRPGAAAQDDGVLLVPTLADDDAATKIAVLDASTLEWRSMLQAPQVVPFGFHAAFAHNA
jgi:beta,beta-carotene 9',10'-dioxygenase